MNQNNEIEEEEDMSSEHVSKLLEDKEYNDE